jgi:hypothetical protein
MASKQDPSAREVPVAALIAHIDRSVDELRAVSAREFRAQAAARRRREAQAWVPIRSAARLRGAR